MNTNTTTSRRTLIKAAPVAAAAAIIPSAVVANAYERDSPIIAAWERRQAAYVRYQQNPFPEDANDPQAAEDAALWAIIDEAEEVIRSTAATTPRGVEIQLWVALYHSFTSREDDAAITRGDLDHLATKEGTLDWGGRLAFAALRSVRAMGA